MNRIILMASLALLAGGVSSSSGQQVADPKFDTKVASPAYTDRHPRVLFDEAHFNFHTADGRYKPFADLIANDGLTVTPNRAKFSSRTLQGGDILIIANALGAAEMDDPGAGNPAFTEAESDAVRDWVKDGGALLLITDFNQFGRASEGLARQFGVDMSNGFTTDLAISENGWPGWLNFTRDNGLLGDHPITQGRSDNERIKRVLTFAGQSLKGPSGSVAFLKLADSAVDQFPQDNKLVSAAGRAQGLAFTFGKGRVVVMGEAGLLSAQVLGPNREPMGMNFPGVDNRQLALNIMHWLESPKAEVAAKDKGVKPKPEPSERFNLDGLITADPLPEGYTAVRQEMKDKDKIIGDLLFVLKDGTMSKVVVAVDRAPKAETRPGKVAATKAYINGTAQALVGAGMKIVKKNIPDLDKADFDKRVVVDLTLEKPAGGELTVQIQVFFEKAGYEIQVVAENKDDFAMLLDWANSVKAAP